MKMNEHIELIKKAIEHQEGLVAKESWLTHIKLDELTEIEFQMLEVLVIGACQALTAQSLFLRQLEEKGKLK